MKKKKKCLGHAGGWGYFFFSGGGGGCWIFLCSHHIPQHVPNSSSLLRPIYLPTILPQEN